MFRRRLEELDAYEVIGTPVVSSGGLAYVPWVETAIEPYNITRLPNCTVHGLWDALRRSAAQPADVAAMAQSA